MSKKKKRVIVSLSNEAYRILIERQHHFHASDGSTRFVYTKSQVIEYALLFGPLAVKKILL